MSQPSKAFHTGVILSIENLGKGEYDVEQVKDTLEEAVNIRYENYPVEVSGNVDTTTWEASNIFYFLGIKIGTLSGNLKNGIRVNLNIAGFKGYIRLYLEGDKLLLTWSVKSRFPGGPKYEDTVGIEIG
ncbi:uncharacterized protein N7446_010835 [Penicillium canescens]|uniref:Uncharacterized protein n=1 Tax=Penicillium canescens TaxID=5083 RepID=A0AAD6IB82_PENCN|nr:uncharacterized protein N7446_010835 [Penicillium canescens]KAJ6041276.1 hypothetical protein N7460_006666 [Penicillium canescens]KAJ6050726.1 hypothetical protein N7446_010835 [Penicillium canescens]KAJ6065947.1 hypothetical protein N7444_001600 [Penicillium canescens]